MHEKISIIQSATFPYLELSAVPIPLKDMPIQYKNNVLPKSLRDKPNTVCSEIIQLWYYIYFQFSNPLNNGHFLHSQQLRKSQSDTVRFLPTVQYCFKVDNYIAFLYKMYITQQPNSSSYP